MDKNTARSCFIDLIQRAYSGELAAAHAYRGHASSVSNPHEKREILEIENEEWHHRARLLEILTELNSTPRTHLEKIFAMIGKTIALLCHFGGWYIPMYGAGKLERGNIVEYEIAARLAHWAELPQYIDELLCFAEVEWQHEQYYRSKVQSHWLHRITGIWSSPPDKSHIREAFAHFLKTNDFNHLATGVFTVNGISRYRFGPQ